MILKNISLKKHSNYKIGGLTDYFYEFNSKEDLIKALNEWEIIAPENKNIFVLGKGTNILFKDSGFRGLVLKNDINFIERSGDAVTVGSGVLVSDLLEFCIQNSLSGLEWAGGLPGTVGGAVRGNAGAFGGETKDSLIEVESLKIESLKIAARNNEECEFDYRRSVYKNGDGKDEVILSAKFELKPGYVDEIRRKTQEKIDYRIDRHPLDLPNIGSTFKNIPVDQVPGDVLNKFKDKIKNDPFPVLPVAKLLAEADLKGKRVGGAMVSPKHPNFIVNVNNAKAEDVLSLIKLIKKEIKEKFDVSLEEEIMIV